MPNLNPFHNPHSKPEVATRPLLSALFPHIKQPLVISAPMLGIANGRLAAAVSGAGGLGFIGGGYDFAPGSPQLETLSRELASAREALGLRDMTLTPLPVGVGFILTHESVGRFEETVMPVLVEHSPQAVWLFAPDMAKGGREAQTAIVEALKHAGFTVFVQVGTVEAARQALADGADVIVAQGIDAGGHQFAKGAGVVSLVPEVRSMIEEHFAGKEVGVVAAGGIVDGRGVAAALALGADGAVMGTRFILCQESSASENARQAITKATDGATSTVKSTFHDAIRGTSSVWPEMYDGRAIISSSYRDHASGISLDENLKRYKEATDAGDNSRLVTWAGTGVGLVKQDLPAGDIVREAQESCIKRIKEMQAIVSHADK